MNPQFFFSGKLSREESASAFLTTLLDQEIEFRSKDSFLASDLAEVHIGLVLHDYEGAFGEGQGAFAVVFDDLEFAHAEAHWAARVIVRL